MMRLPFDAHNHVHMGTTEPFRALLGKNLICDGAPAAVSGIALMSTHPRDYSRVLQLSKELPAQHDVDVVPCFGVHPWFLHELSSDDWQEGSGSVPKWLNELEQWIESCPRSIVGEIGLDGHRYDPKTGNLSSPIRSQVEAFERQMEMAARLQRPVSVHCVQCWGPMLDVLSRLKGSSSGLPPSIYFHAFGGKVGTVDQLLALCGRETGRTYFGFAPVINFRSPKTASVIQKVGLNRLLLETDHEDAAKVPESLEVGVQLLAEALCINTDEIVHTTTQNAHNMYRL